MARLLDLAKFDIDTTVLADTEDATEDIEISGRMHYMHGGCAKRTRCVPCGHMVSCPTCTPKVERTHCLPHMPGGGARNGAHLSVVNLGGVGHLLNTHVAKSHHPRQILYLSPVFLLSLLAMCCNFFGKVLANLWQTLWGPFPLSVQFLTKQI